MVVEDLPTTTPRQRSRISEMVDLDWREITQRRVAGGRSLMEPGSIAGGSDSSAGRAYFFWRMKNHAIDENERGKEDAHGV